MTARTGYFETDKQHFLLRPICLPYAGEGRRRYLLITVGQFYLIHSVLKEARGFTLVNAPSKKWGFAAMDVTRRACDERGTRLTRAHGRLYPSLATTLVLCGGIRAFIAPSLLAPEDPSLARVYSLAQRHENKGLAEALSDFLLAGIECDGASEESRYFCFGEKLAACCTPMEGGSSLLFTPPARRPAFTHETINKRPPPLPLAPDF